MARKTLIGRILGPALFFVILLFVHPEGLGEAGRMVLATTVWIGVWWVTEAIPLPVTSLLPLVFFPLLGVSSIKPVAQTYINPIMFLFVGGFMLALAMERWNLHRRIALHIIARVGTNARMIVLGFMLATGVLSMWISNTATTLMMVPIALAIVSQIEALAAGKSSGELGKVLMLGIAWSASIGGMATLVGTPTNLIFTGYVNEVYQYDFSFSQWFVFGFPVSLLLLFTSWLILTFVSFPLKKVNASESKAEIQKQLRNLGPVSVEELSVMIVFGLVAVGWMMSSWLKSNFFPQLHDSSIAILGAASLFLIPSSRKGVPLMDWETAVRLPWGILLLFGGAFAIAFGFESSGLAAWLADQLSGLNGVPYFFILMVIIGFVNFLTEITQNMATCTLMMPVLASLAPAIDVHPFPLMAATCMASSCAFMLPFATAPNVIVFGSGQLEMKDMIRAGIWMNLVSILVIVLYTYLIIPVLWDMDMTQFPIDLLGQ